MQTAHGDGPMQARRADAEARAGRPGCGGLAAERAEKKQKQKERATPVRGRAGAKASKEGNKTGEGGGGGVQPATVAGCVLRSGGTAKKMPTGGTWATSDPASPRGLA